MGRPPPTRPQNSWWCWTGGCSGATPGSWPGSRLTAGATVEVVTLAGAPLLFEGGEHLKNDPLNVTIVQQAIHAAGLCRHSYVAAVGGGALIDMAGFAAATAHRGVRLIRVPTTVLAQADASIGVKNSINAFGQKNFIGAFAPPVAVLNDVDFLTTLSQRDWIGGVAEAVKVALIKDADFFAFLEKHAGSLARPGPGRHAAGDLPLAPRFTWTTSPAAATPLSPAPPGPWTSATGRPTSWST